MEAWFFGQYPYALIDKGFTIYKVYAVISKRIEIKESAYFFFFGKIHQHDGMSLLNKFQSCSKASLNKWLFNYTFEHDWRLAMSKSVGPLFLQNTFLNVKHSWTLIFTENVLEKESTRNTYLYFNWKKSITAVCDYN